jgi:hypothetical protein
MTAHVMALLGQLDASKLNSEARLDVAASSMWTWVFIALIVVGVLLITFKTSKRNVTDRD